MFNSYVSLPEGTIKIDPPPSILINWWPGKILGSHDLWSSWNWPDFCLSLLIFRRQKFETLSCLGRTVHVCSEVCLPEGIHIANNPSFGVYQDYQIGLVV
jgi:hypothetical protein